MKIKDILKLWRTREKHESWGRKSLISKIIGLVYTNPNLDKTQLFAIFKQCPTIYTLSAVL